MTPIESEPCGHSCCVDDGKHDHPITPDACPDCQAVADVKPVHPLETKALRVASRRHPDLSPDEREQPE